MPITVKLKSDFKLDGSYIISMTEYSQDQLVVKVPNELLTEEIFFSWISPSNTKFTERVMSYSAELSDETHKAFVGNIYLAMTAGISGQSDTGTAMFSFRSEGFYSPVVRVTVNKSILPDIIDYPDSQVEEILDKIKFTEVLTLNKDESFDYDTFPTCNAVTCFIKVNGDTGTMFFHPEDLIEVGYLEHVIHSTPTIIARLDYNESTHMVTFTVSGTIEPATAKFRTLGA